METKEGKMNKLMCMNCIKDYNKEETIRKIKSNHFGLLDKIKETCPNCKSINKMRPEKYWTKENKEKYLDGLNKEFNNSKMFKAIKQVVREL